MVFPEEISRLSEVDGSPNVGGIRQSIEGLNAEKDGEGRWGLAPSLPSGLNCNSDYLLLYVILVLRPKVLVWNLYHWLCSSQALNYTTNFSESPTCTHQPMGLSLHYCMNRSLTRSTHTNAHNLPHPIGSVSLKDSDKYAPSSSHDSQKLSHEICLQTMSMYTLEYIIVPCWEPLL